MEKYLYSYYIVYLMAYCSTNCMNTKKISKEFIYNSTYLDVFSILLLSFSFKKIPPNERHTEINKFLTLFFIGTIVFISQRNLFWEGLMQEYENKHTIKILTNEIISYKKEIDDLKQMTHLK